MQELSSIPLRHEFSMEPIAVNVADAAKLLGVSIPTMYNIVRRRDFPAFKIDGRTFISVEGLKEWTKTQAENYEWK